MQEMMTLREVCAYFRVDRRVLVRFGLERLGGVQLGPRSWRFHRSFIVRYGLSQSEQKPGQVPVDGATLPGWQEATQVLCNEERGAALGSRRTSRVRDAYDLLA